MAQPSKYVYKSKLVWEEANGKIPRGKQILFLDQNKENVTLENMILVDKNLMGTINKIYKLSSDKDINKAIVALAKLERDINDRR